jgi:hypothetical protein
MNNKNKISLDNLKNTNPFGVNEDYFANLESKIIQRSEALNNPQLAFSVPENYEETLANSILKNTSEFEINETNTIPFTVPDKYFETLNSQIQYKKQQQTAKSKISILENWKTQLAIPLAVAASLAIIITIGINNMDNKFVKKSSNNTANQHNFNIDTKINSINKNDIIEYLAMDNENIAQEISSIAESSPISLKNNDSRMKHIKKEEIKQSLEAEIDLQELETLTDEELQ